jgi:hypothetical protein
MPNRTAKFASLAFAGLLAVAALVTISGSAARAADDCLSAPKDETPAGQHWYYRIEHGTKRHCWYLRDEGDKPAQTASPDASPPANPAPARAAIAAPRSIEDAHAELPPEAPAERQTENDKPNPALPPNALGIDRVQGAEATDMTAPSSVVVSRWPKPSSASSSVAPRPAMSDATAIAQPAPAETPSALTPVTLAPADSSARNHSGTIPMLLTTIAGALAAAGIVGGTILKLGAARRPRRARLRARRGAIWERTDDDRIVLSGHPGADVLRRRTGFGRTGNRRASADDRVAEFFSQLSRRNPA